MMTKHTPKPHRPQRGLAVAAIFVVMVWPAVIWAETPTFEDTTVGDRQKLELHFTVMFSEDALVFERLGGYDIVRLDGADYTCETGKPMLPARTVRVAVPQGMTVTRAQAVRTETVQLAGEYSVFPAQAPRPMSGPVQADGFIAPDPETYTLPGPYPAQTVEFVHQNDLAGQAIALVRLHPLQYVPATKRLILHTAIDVVLEGVDGYECGDYLPATLSESGRWAYERAVRDMVLNPDDVELSLSSTVDAGLRGVGAGQYDYVIITDSSWVGAFQPLADWRTRRGMPAAIVTTSWIYNDGGYAGTDVEKVRAFVQDAHANWGASYFLLGGDTNIIPVHIRTITVPDYWTDDIPNDTHYADYDEDWVCEVHVGRASVLNVNHISTFIGKVLAYEKTPPTTDYAQTAVFLGMDTSEPGDQYGELSKENVGTLHLPVSWTLNTEYDSEPGTHKADFIGYLNWGHHLVNHNDHCNTYSMGAGWTCHSELIQNPDVNALINGDRLSIVFAIGCWPCDIPATTSIGEAFLRHANGGAIAFMGNSRYGWGGAPPDRDKYSNRQDRLFYRNLFDDGFERLGDNFSDLKNDVFEPDDPYNLHQYCFTQLHLLGDPGLTLWTEDPQGLTVTHDDTVFAGEGTIFPVQVYSGGNPVDQATVCLWKDGDVYAVEQTDPTGTATLGFVPGSSGTLYVTVTGHNYLPYEGTAEVVEPTCQAQSARSCRDHGPAGNLCLDMDTDSGIDPRMDGITELEIELDDTLTFAGGVTITCVNAGDVSARVSGTSVDGHTVTVSFSPALPDQDACTVELDCGASVCVRGLEGDLNLSGQTNTTDTSQLKLRFGQDAATAGPQWDFNTSGEVNTTDFGQIKLRFGNTAPVCP